MRRTIVALTLAAATLAGCRGFKEAMTAHVDVAARAGGQELSVERLSQLLAQAKAPPSPEIARAVTDLWVNYQLLGQAAAHRDTLTNPKVVDDALWPIIAQGRAAKFHDELIKSQGGDVDSTGAEARYNQGDLLAARHILFTVPQNATPAVRDSVRKRAEQVRAQLTSANFADMAKRYSQDPGSAQRGGDLGVFPKGMMVPAFQQAVLGLHPGEISGVVETPFGYHIIRRSTYPEVKDQFLRAANASKQEAADSVWFDKLDAEANVKIRDKAPDEIRAAAKNLDAHTTDNTVIATSKLGDFTVGRMVHWVQSIPQRPQIEQGLQSAPDSQIVQFVKSLVRTELVLRKADSAKVQLDTADLNQLHNRFGQLVAEAWDQLGVSPAQLADSAKSTSQAERVAAEHVDSYLDRLMTNQVRFVPVPPPLQTVLRQKYDWSVNQAGIERAVERAKKERAVADSARAKNRPATEIPMGQPGASPAAPNAAPAPKPSAPDSQH